MTPHDPVYNVSINAALGTGNRSPGVSSNLCSISSRGLRVKNEYIRFGRLFGWLRTPPAAEKTSPRHPELHAKTTSTAFFYISKRLFWYINLGPDITTFTSSVTRLRTSPSNDRILPRFSDASRLGAHRCISNPAGQLGLNAIYRAIRRLAAPSACPRYQHSRYLSLDVSSRIQRLCRRHPVHMSQREDRSRLPEVSSAAIADRHQQRLTILGTAPASSHSTG